MRMLMLIAAMAIMGVCLQIVGVFDRPAQTEVSA
jgi:hypothetical protein